MNCGGTCSVSQTPLPVRKKAQPAAAVAAASISSRGGLAAAGAHPARGLGVGGQAPAVAAHGL